MRRERSQPAMERVGSKSADLLKKILELVGASRELSRPPFGGLLKWPTRADCKSAGLRLRWFESITHHQFPESEETPRASGPRSLGKRNLPKSSSGSQNSGVRRRKKSLKGEL